jgi:sortase A
LAQNRRSAGHFEVELDIAIPELPEVLQNLPYVDRNDVIGYISIDRVNLFLPIFHGATNVNLLAGAGTMHYNQRMGVGNFPLAGHHMSDPTILFGPTLHVRVGDIVQITDRTNLYSYRVVEAKLVHQSEVEILNDTAIPTVTLFTCDTSSIATDFRWVIIAQIIDESSLEGTHGGTMLTTEARGNPYLVTFQQMNERVLLQERQNGLLRWGLMIAGISFVVCILGMILFARIEKRYLYLKRRREQGGG